MMGPATTTGPGRPGPGAPRRARVGTASCRRPAPVARAPSHHVGRGELPLLVVLGDVEVRELLGEARVRASRADVLQGRDVLVERRPEPAQAVAVAEPQLSGDLVLVEQPDLVHRAGQ